MLARGGKLVSFGEYKKKAQNDVYYPGEVYPRGEATPSVEEGYNLRHPYIRWDFPFESPEYDNDRALGSTPVRRKLGRPTRELPTRTMVEPSPRRTAIVPFAGSSFARFSGGKSLREFGKTKILANLRFLPSDHIPVGTVPFKGIRNIPQRPQYFPELAGFGEAPVGEANATGGGPVETGVWGNLVSLLTTAGQVVLQTETQRTQRGVAASQAAIAASQAQTTQSRILASLYNNLPLLFALSGGGALLYVYMSKKKVRARV